MGLRPTHAVVDLDALAFNYHAIERRLPGGCAVMPVVKADAYGHVASAVAGRLEREGAASFAVAVVEEGAELRRAGVRGEILVMGWIGPNQLPDLLRHGLVANGHSLELLAELRAFAEAREIELPLHLKLDTGFTRLGLKPSDLGEAVEILRRAKGHLRVVGAFQNFASADDDDSPQTAAQAHVFSEMVQALAASGFPPPLLHTANSAATLRPPAWPRELPPPGRVRPGLALYTRFPGLPEAGLRDVMSFVSVVDQVKRIAPGERVGYGGAFSAPRPMTVAIVPAGYADGVPRSLEGKGCVLVLGRRCLLLGRISMDLVAVDVTDLLGRPGRGDEVVFFGTQGGERLGVEELAREAGTVPWEILCGVGPRVPRVIVEEGSPNRLVSRFLVPGDPPSE